MYSLSLQDCELYKQFNLFIVEEKVIAHYFPQIAIRTQIFISWNAYVYPEIKDFKT